MAEGVAVSSIKINNIMLSIITPSHLCMTNRIIKTPINAGIMNSLRTIIPITIIFGISAEKVGPFSIELPIVRRMSGTTDIPTVVNPFVRNCKGGL